MDTDRFDEVSGRLGRTSLVVQAISPVLENKQQVSVGEKQLD